MVVAETKKRIMITVSKDIANMLDKMADKQGLSKSALVTTWINQEIQKA